MISFLMTLFLLIVLIVPELSSGAGKKDEDDIRPKPSICLKKIDERLRAGELSQVERQDLVRIRDDLSLIKGAPKDREKKILEHLNKYYSAEIALLARNGVKLLVDADSKTCNASGLYYQTPEKKLVLCNVKDEILTSGISTTFEHEFLHFLQANDVVERETITKKYLSLRRNGIEHIPEQLCNHTRDRSHLKMSEHLNNKITEVLAKLSSAQKDLIGELDKLESLYALELDKSGQLRMEEKFTPRQNEKIQEVFATILNKAKGDRGKAMALIENSLPYPFGEYFFKNDSCGLSSVSDLSKCFENYKNKLSEAVKDSSTNSNFREIMELAYKQNRCLGHLARYCDELQANAQSQIRDYNIVQTLSRQGLQGDCSEFATKVGSGSLESSSLLEVEKQIYAKVKDSISKSAFYGREFSIFGGYNYAIFDVKYCQKSPDWSFYRKGCPNFDPGESDTYSNESFNRGSSSPAKTK